MYNSNCLFFFSKRQRNNPEPSADEWYAQQKEDEEMLERWIKYNNSFSGEYTAIERAIKAQNDALTALREESEELYQAAIQVNKRTVQVHTILNNTMMNNSHCHT